MDPRSKYADVDGVHLHWVEMGDPTDLPPLVLLHGLNDSHLTWLHVAPLLAARRQVLIPDLAGCGHSDRPDASYALEWHAHLIASWLRGLGLRHIDVAGHSFGGGVAQMLLLEKDIRVRRLALVAPGGLGTRVHFSLRLATLPGVVERWGQPFMSLATRIAMRGLCESMPTHVVESLCEMNGREGSARAFARTVQDVISWRGQSRCFMHRAKDITRLPPTLLLAGDRDTVTPIENALDFAKAVQGVEFVRFEGCGHFVHHEQPDVFARKLDAFLEAPYARRPRLQASVEAEAVSLWDRAWSSLMQSVRPVVTERTAA